MEDKIYIPIEIDDEDGMVVCETSESVSSCDELIADILAGYCPHRVIAIDLQEVDVSQEIAREVVARAWDLDIELTHEIKEFCEAHGVKVPMDIRIIGGIYGNR